MFSVKKPAATDQMVSSMPLASSNTSRTPEKLWTPAYASGFSADHSRPSTPQYRVPSFRSRSTSSVSHLAGISRVALTSNQWLLRDMDSHLVISAHVTERNCASLLADTMVVEPIRVVSIQMTNQLTSADLPIPRPELVAMRKVSKSTLPLFALMWSASRCSTSRCHLRGPSKCSSGVPFWPHGKTNNTNLSGSSLMAGVHSRLISSISSSALYRVVCMFYLGDGFCQPLDDPPLRLLQRGGDGDGLVDLDLHGLLGHPAVRVLQHLKRGLGVAGQRSVTQNAGHLHLAVSAALVLGQRRHRVELTQGAVLARQHTGGQGQRVALQTLACGLIDCVQPRLGGLQSARLVGQ